MEGGKYASVDEDSEIFNEALRLHRLGHKDMIDNILYASAGQLGLLLPPSGRNPLGRSIFDSYITTSAAYINLDLKTRSNLRT